MSMSLIKLLAHVGQLEKSKWACEYQGERWQVEGVELKLKLKTVELRCTISRDDQQHRLALLEHVEGGGDTLTLDDQECEADHEVSVKFKLFPPSVKIKLKSEFDVDDQPGFEEVIRLATKLPVSL